MKNIRLSVILTLLFSTVKTSAQVPLFNSYPTATAVLFLDFDGHKVEGTNWNMEGTIFCGPSNLNATQVAMVYNRVAEDFRPFNINVTTDSAAYGRLRAKRLQKCF